jgi:hypothetical protein
MAAYEWWLTYNFVIFRDSHHRFIFSLASPATLDSQMSFSESPLPQWLSPTKLFHSRISRRRNGFFYYFNSVPGIGIFISSFTLVGFILYTTFFSPQGLLLPNTSNWSIPTMHVSSESSPASAPSSPSGVLSLEQIRDIVTPTRGFFSRDYSLYLGWNNVSIHGNIV